MMIDHKWLEQPPEIIDHVKLHAENLNKGHPLKDGSYCFF